MITTDQMLQQYRQHTKKMGNGDLVIGLPDGVYDLFCNKGWDDPIRFRIIRFKDHKRPPQLIQIKGEITLSREYREALLKELH